MHPISRLHGRWAACRLVAVLLLVAGWGLAVPVATGGAAEPSGTVLGWGDNLNGQLAEGAPGRAAPGLVHGLRDVTAIDAGTGHTLALTRDGTLWSWGRNVFGQVGDGTTVSRFGPVKVPLAGVVAFAAGGGNSIAATSDGSVWTWGFNLFGQIGDGTGGPGPDIIKSRPVRVPSLHDVVAVETGGGHCFALTRDGTVWSWGRNLQGQLGDGTTTDRFTPVRVGGLHDVRSIAAGNGDGFALLADGTVRAWGYNDRGQLGDGSTTDRLTPVTVAGLDGVTTISAAYHHTLGLLADGTVRAWGLNDQGQLGDGSTTDRLTPVTVAGLRGVTKIAANGGGDVDKPGNFGHSMALLRDGTARAWGANDKGQLGDGSTVSRSTPVRVEELRRIVDIDAGGEVPPSRPGPGGGYSAAVTSDGIVHTWGDNVVGQLGDGPAIARATPGKVAGDLSDVAAIDSGSGHTLALAGGALWAWGRNVFGQLGDGTTVYRSSPARVRGVHGVTAFAAGADHSLAVTRDGSVWAWGSRSSGRLGDGSSGPDAAALTPVRVAGLHGVRSVAAGAGHSLALAQDGTVWAWGRNDRGQLGDGSTTDRNTPVRVSIPGRIVSLAAGAGHSLALAQDGTVWAWGRNDRGQLGDGTSTDRLTPVQVAGLHGVRAISAAYHYSAAVLWRGSVRAWGVNDKGQLGDGTTTDRLTPVPVVGLSGVRAVSVNGGGTAEAPGGSGHGIALLRDGSLRAWGVNDKGQLGDGTTTDRPTPVEVPGLSEVSAIDAGGEVAASQPAPGGGYSTALTRDGRVETWGDNVNGQLGDGAAIGWSQPKTVLSGLRDVTHIEAGFGHTLAQTGDGSLWAFGRNVFGQLGDGTTSSRTNPVRVRLDNVVGFDAGGGHSLVVTADGSVWGWGFNIFGQVGDGTGGIGPNILKPNPVKLAGLPPVQSVVAAGGHSLALARDGTVWAWGLNAVGELGDGTNDNRFVPGKVKGLPPGIAAIAAGGGQNLALARDGTVWAWGDNRSGAVGDGSGINRSIPVQVSGLSGVRAIATGTHFSLALLHDGTVRAWGLDDNGQLGDGGSTNKLSPVPVSGLRDVQAIAAAGGGDDVSPARFGHSLALLSDGTVRAWGYNDRGQLGDGSTITRRTPVEVPGLQGVKAVFLGADAPPTRPGPSGEFSFALT